MSHLSVRDFFETRSNTALQWEKDQQLVLVIGMVINTALTTQTGDKKAAQVAARLWDVLEKFDKKLIPAAAATQ